MANAWSNPYSLSPDDEAQIENVEVQDPGLPRGAVIDVQIGKGDPWSNPYNLPPDVDDAIRKGVAFDEGAPRGTTYSAQGDDELSGADPFKAFGSKAAAKLWANVMAQPSYNRRAFLQQVLVKLSPQLWTTVEQAATREQAAGRSAQEALRIGLGKAFTQQMIEDLMSSGWKQAAVGLAGLGACCDACAGREGLGWSIGGSISSIGSGIAQAGGAVVSAAKQVAELACDAVNSPLARPAANYGGYAQGGTAGSAGAVKGLEKAQAACGAGAKISSALSQPTQTVVTKSPAPRTNIAVAVRPTQKKFPVAPVLIGAGVLAFFLLRK